MLYEVRTMRFIKIARTDLNMKQIILAYAEEIANSAKGHVAEAYKKALQEVRLP